MLLNYRLRISKNINKTVPIVVIHGLFGNLSNLGILSAGLAQYYDVIQIDLRNHGRSPHHRIMDYIVMAQDILNLLNYFSIKKCTVIGHSIGGKIAMTLGILAKQYIDKIVVIDIAPKKYNIYKYQNVFSAINYINRSKITNKHDIIDIMKKNCINPYMISFLLKSFQKGNWNFNCDFIINNYHNINDWTIHDICWKSALFIRGELSSYISDVCVRNIYKQFPFSYIHTVPNARHWVHFDNPVYIFNIIKNFILTKININYKFNMTN